MACCTLSVIVNLSRPNAVTSHFTKPAFQVLQRMAAACGHSSHRIPAVFSVIQVAFSIALVHGVFRFVADAGACDGIAVGGGRTDWCFLAPVTTTPGAAAVAATFSTGYLHTFAQTLVENETGLTDAPVAQADGLRNGAIQIYGAKLSNSDLRGWRSWNGGVVVGRDRRLDLYGEG